MVKFNREPVVNDIGIDETLESLDESQIKKAIDRVLKGKASARLKTFVTTCLRCGMCSTSCYHYLSHDNGPTYAPAAKVKQTIWEILKKDGKVSKEDINKYTRIGKRNAEILYLAHGLEAKYMTGLLTNMAKIMNVAKTDWTMPDCDGWDYTNKAFYAQGWKENPIPYLQGVEFFYKLLKSGKIKIGKKLKESVTLQDPCNIIRNYCCSDSGGTIEAGPPWKMARMEGGRVKAEQIKET